MSSTVPRTRGEQVQETRLALMNAAEQLVAQHGVHAVSIRQISEAAGQGNNAAVNYHFGTKTDLLRAIAERHAANIDDIRRRLVAEIDGSGDLDDWVRCVVESMTLHLDSLGRPSWFARFLAQVTADPQLHQLALEVFNRDEPTMARVRDQIARSLPAHSTDVYAIRAAMMRHLINQICVDHERALSEHTADGMLTWQDTADRLVEAIVGVWTVPQMTRRPGRG